MTGHPVFRVTSQGKDPLSDSSQGKDPLSDREPDAGARGPT
jgi:hypothetical protein